MPPTCNDEEGRRGPADRLSPESRTVVISVNPSAGAGPKRRAVVALVRCLCRAGCDVRLVSDREELAAEVDRCGSEKLRCVVAAGGDGTVADVVNRVPQAPLALFPLGTENLLARYWGARTGAVATTETIVRGAVQHVDLPTANGRSFLLMAGLGLDAEVVHRLARSRRGHVLRTDYGKPILEALRSYRYPELQVSTDPHRESLRARIAFVFNLPCYALGFPLAPEARGDDGMLDLVLFEGGSTRESLRYAWAVMRHRHHSLPDVQTRRVRRIRFESRRPVPVQLDGDPFGYTPLEIEIGSQALRLIVPCDPSRGRQR